MGKRILYYSVENCYIITKQQELASQTETAHRKLFLVPLVLAFVYKGISDSSLKAKERDGGDLKPQIYRRQNSIYANVSNRRLLQKGRLADYWVNRIQPGYVH